MNWPRADSSKQRNREQARNRNTYLFWGQNTGTTTAFNDGDSAKYCPLQAVEQIELSFHAYWSQRPSVISGRYRPPCLRARPPSDWDRRLWENHPHRRSQLTGTDRKAPHHLTFRGAAPHDTHAAPLLRRPLAPGPSAFVLSPPTHPGRCPSAGSSSGAPPV